MAETRVVNFCTQKDYIKSCQRDDESPSKGAWLGSHDPFFAFITGLVTPISKNNALHGRTLLLALSAVDASDTTH